MGDCENIIEKETTERRKEKQECRSLRKELCGARDAEEAEKLAVGRMRDLFYDKNEKQKRERTNKSNLCLAD